MSGASGIGGSMAQAPTVAGAGGLSAIGMPTVHQMPGWQSDLMGALTGKTAYNINAPAMHQAMGNVSTQIGGSQQAPSGPSLAQMLQLMQRSQSQMQPLSAYSAGLPTVASLAPWLRGI